MKILYGVQGTGNGHISRARVVARQFQEAGADVDYLFSGRPRENFFDMEVFGDCMYRRGLTFQTENGQTLYGKTLLKNSLTRLVWDILQLDTSPYDYIITDFEPITAWAGKLRNVPVIGIGHQYAFEHPVPCDGETALARNIMKYFAPAQHSFGLHWHHFMAVERSDRLIAELQSSDAIIIGAPVYNYSIPSTLKAWIDHITRAGITFRYSEKGPQGLVTGKKVYVVTARGGGPVEHIEMQIAETFKMMGMTDIQFLHAGNLDSPEQASLIHSNYGNEKVTSITGNDQISSMEFLEA